MEYVNFGSAGVKVSPIAASGPPEPPTEATAVAEHAGGRTKSTAQHGHREPRLR
mgnify:CR=1 FL=1